MRALVLLTSALPLLGSGVSNAGQTDVETGLVVDDTRERMRVVRDDISGQLDIFDNGQPVLRYNYRTVDPPEGFVDRIRKGLRKYAVARSNYIHPLYGPNGEVLTRDWPVPHPHHRGIYWAWPEVQYEGELGDLHALQRVFARPTGNIELSSGANLGQIDVEHLWKWEDRTPIVRERAVIRAYPAGEQGRYVDLRFELTALVDGVSLARRKTQNYGGLNIRFERIGRRNLVHHADPPESAPRAAWQLASGTWRDAKATASFTVFERVSNPNYPADYVEYPDLPWIQPAFPKAGTRHALEKTEPLVLEYRLWICGGVPDPEQLREQWNIYNPPGAKESN